MALAKLAEEDPTFQVRIDPDSGQTIINGMVSFILRSLLTGSGGNLMLNVTRDHTGGI